MSRLLLCLVLFCCATARAADFDVNTLDDHDDGICDLDCTLREATNAANNAAGDDQITFSVTGTINLGSALPALSDNLTILGKNVTVRRNSGGNYSVFSVNGSVTATLQQLTISNGGDTTISGGAINNSGTLTINNCTLIGNNAGNGGAINNSGTLTANNCTFSGNSGVFGGAISNGGTLTINNSTFNGNTTSNYGGAIFNDNSVTLTNCTFTDNEAALGGGALRAKADEKHTTGASRHKSFFSMKAISSRSKRFPFGQNRKCRCCCPMAH